VPESLLGIGEQKYSNAEQQHLMYQNYTINPILEAIAQEFHKKLIASWRPRETIEFKPSPLKYATSKEKAETVSLLRNSSIMTANEAREIYDLILLDGDVANKLKDDLETSSDVNQAVGDSLAEPKNTEETNPTAGEQPITDSQYIKE
jgi:hypothetical protein